MRTTSALRVIQCHRQAIGLSEMVLTSLYWSILATHSTWGQERGEMQGREGPLFLKLQPLAAIVSILSMNNNNKITPLIWAKEGQEGW